VEKNQFDLCLAVLRRLGEQRLLDHFILIGSWALIFYDKYFAGQGYAPSIRTRDIDFLLPLPLKMRESVDIPKLLEDLGFIVDHVGQKGFIRLSHPELIVEFLVPERGRGSDQPYSLPKLKINAQPLRYLDLLALNIITVKHDDILIKVPHPAAFALHKLIIFKRRAKKFKAGKDVEQALMIMDMLIKKRDQEQIIKIFRSLPNAWQKTIANNLIFLERSDVIDLFK